jgi:trans-aconitate methyltransferase
MDHYKETFETWNKLASLYEERFMHLTMYNETYDLFCKSIESENPEILEIGCGPGNITRYLLDKRPDFKIHATDIAPNMIELAKKNNPEATFSIMDCRNIDQLDKKFDGIVCGFCIPFISTEETLKLINDCANKLKEKGIIYLSFVDSDQGETGFKSTSTGERTYFNYHPLTTILTNLRKNDFSQIKAIPVQFKRSENETEIHTIVVAKIEKT